MNREKITRIFSIALIAICLFSLGWNVVSNGRVFDATLYDDYLDTGNDFFNSVAYVRGRVPYTQFNTIYPPLANAFYLMITHAVPTEFSDQWGTSFGGVGAMRMTSLDLRLYQDTAFPFILSTAIFVVLLYQLCMHGLRGSAKTKWLFSTAMLLSIGVLQALERGNIIVLATCLVLFFIQFKDSPSKVVSELALISLGAAAGFKLYPAIFGLVLLLDRQYRKAIRAVIYGLILFFVPFFLFEGFSAIKLYFQQLILFNDLSAAFSHIGLSLAQMADTVLRVLNLDQTSPVLYATALQAMGRLTFVLMVAAIALCFVTKYRWKVLTLLSLITLLFPSRTAMYGLCMMIVAAVSFFNEAAEHSRFKWIYTALFFLLFAFFPYSLQLIARTQVVQVVVQSALFLLFVLVMLDILLEAFARGKGMRAQAIDGALAQPQ